MLIWHPELIRFLKTYRPEWRVRVLEDLNNGTWNRPQPDDDLKTGYIWTTFRQLVDNNYNEWTGGDEWEQFKGYLDDDTITKPLNGFYHTEEKCWFVEHDDAISYYVMEYLMLDIETYQSINFKVTTLGKSL